MKNVVWRKIWNTFNKRKGFWDNSRCNSPFKEAAKCIVEDVDIVKDLE